MSQGICSTSVRADHHDACSRHTKHKKTTRQRGHAHTRESTRVRSKPQSSSAQRHSSHSKRTLLINSIRSHGQRGGRLMERYPDVALAPHLCSLLSTFPSVSPPITVPSIQLSFPLSVPVRSPSQAALKKSKVPKSNKKNMKINWLLTGNLLFFFLYCFFFF